MKKILSLAALLLLVLGTTCLTSCSKDDDNGGGESSGNTATFTYYLSDDFLNVFDVTLTAKSGTTSQNISLSGGTATQFKVADASYTGKQFKSTMNIGSSKEVNVTANVTLKSGWSTYVASLSSVKLAMLRTIDVTGHSDADQLARETKGATEETLTAAANAFAIHLAN